MKELPPIIEDLRRNTEYQRALDAIDDHAVIPKWKPGQDLEVWAERSGFCKGIEFVLNSLGYDRENRHARR